MIRAVQNSDSKTISEIYNHYIANSVATFEEELICASEIESRIEKVASDNLPWLVIENDEKLVIGYAYASKWRVRSAYRFSVESTVYIADNAKGKGLGSQLYQALFEQLKQLSIKVIISGITLPNDACIALHEKFGMKKVAHFEKVGIKFNQSLDTGYWQVNL